MTTKAVEPLTIDQAMDIVRQSIAAVAPDVEDELDSIDPTRDIFDEFELDSMDHANVMTQLFERTGIAIPENEYATLRGMSPIAEYLATTSQEST